MFAWVAESVNCQCDWCGVAARELLGHDDRVLGGQEELRRARDLVRHGSDDRGVRVAAEHREVARVRVDVPEAVDVGEAGTVAVGDVDRLVVVGGHPGHRGAVRHVRAGPLEQGHGRRALRAEPGELLLVEGADPSAIEVAVGRHRRAQRATRRTRSHPVDEAEGADRRVPVNDFTILT